MLYIEGVAIRGGPESCGGAREGVVEALAGGVWAGLLSREINPLGCRRRPGRRKAMSAVTLARVAVGPCAVGEPGHVRKSPCARTGRSHVCLWSLVMPRPLWFAGWHAGGWRAVRGRPRP
jgi:hypothetical protein